MFDINHANPKLGGDIENEKSGANTFMDVNQVTGEFQIDLWVKTPTSSKIPAIKIQNRFGALAAVGEDIEINAADKPESTFQRQADPL